ncbi:MAG: CapA family protein [Bacteroidales bacterium]|nr:CapA family protein [Bacteroidales bacterium]
MQTYTRHLICIITAVSAIFANFGTYLHSQNTSSGYFKTNLEKARPLFRQDTLEICIIGDIMMHARQIAEAKCPYGSFDFSSYFSLISGKISEADIAVANMEFTLAGEPYTGYPCFSAPDCLASYLTETGFDVFLAANNHICDKGSKGAMRTISIYRALEKEGKIRLTGIAENEEALRESHPLMIRKKGISLAFVNFTYGTNCQMGTDWPKVNMMNDRRSLKEAMEKAGAADFTIVLPHWGTEYRHRHSAEQEENAKWLADNGADIIIGAHPHVVQDFRKLHINDGKKEKIVPVAYSLGNAVSNMSAPGTQLELMAKIRIVRELNGDMRMLPVEFIYLWCSGPGGYGKSFTVVPVSEFIGRRDEWTGAFDYDKMVQTYRKVIRETGIEDGYSEAIQY